MFYFTCNHILQAERNRAKTSENIFLQKYLWKMFLFST